MAVIRLDMFVVLPWILLITLFVLCTVQLALIAHVVGWTNSESTFIDTSSVGQSERQGKVPLPPGLNYESSACLLASSACGVLIPAILGLVVFATQRGLSFELNFGHFSAKASPLQKRVHISFVVALLCGVLAALTTGTLIYSFYDQTRPSNEFIHYSGATTNAVSGYGEYQTPESWTCALANEATSLNILRQQCRQTRAARFLLIPVLATTVVLALCLFWRQKVAPLTKDELLETTEIEGAGDEKRKSKVSRRTDTENTVVELDAGSPTEVDGEQVAELPQTVSELPGPKMTYKGGEYFAGTAIPSSSTNMGWPIDRVTLWLSVSNFSLEWQETFRQLELEEDRFLDLGRDEANKKDTTMMYQKVLPELAHRCRENGTMWDRQQARGESRRLQRLVRSILED